MGDEYDCKSVMSQFIEDFEQAIYFVGGKNAGRLIQYQDLSMGHDELDQFYLLTFS